MKERGYIELSVVPCRKEPSHRSEMVNQLLFGESFTIIDEQEDWYHIVADYDDYACWIEKKQTVLTNIRETNGHRQPVLMQSIYNKAIQLKILRGSVLYNYNNARIFNNFGIEWRIDEQTEFIFGEKNIEKTALSYLNTPYLWGGKTPFGIDCSGYTQMVFAINNIKLKRDAWQQAEQGSAVFIKDVLPGDLAFFSNKVGKITHVGIVLQDNHIIHASGKVRIDIFDERGIFNVETNTYSHQLAFLKRIN